MFLNGFSLARKSGAVLALLVGASVAIATAPQASAQEQARPLPPGAIVTELGDPDSTAFERILPLELEKEISEFGGSHFWPAVTFGPGGEMFVPTPRGDYSFNPETSELEEVLLQPIPEAVRNVAFGPDGALYTAYGDERDKNGIVHRRSTTSGELRVHAGSLDRSADVLEDGGLANSGGKFSGLISMAFDRDGNLFVAEMTGHRVRRIDAVTGIVSTVAGNGTPGFSGDGGPAAEAQLRWPHGVAVGPDGAVVIADMGNQRVRRVDPATGVISTIFESELDGAIAADGRAAALTSVAVDGGGNVFFGMGFVDYLVDGVWLRMGNGTGVVRRLDAETGQTDVVVGSPDDSGREQDGIAATEYRFAGTHEGPLDLLVGPSGHLWITTQFELLRVEQAAVPVPLFDFPAPLLCAGEPVTVDLGAGEVPTAEDDVIRGTAGPDVIAAGEGNDLVCGLDGDDVIAGGGGADKIFGGAGDDLVRGQVGNDRLVGGPGSDRLEGGRGNDRLFGGAGSDLVRGGVGNDHLSGGPGSDTLLGFGGADELRGNQGRDQLNGGDGPDVLRGGFGQDGLNGGNGDDACGTIADESRTQCERGLLGLS